MILREKTVLEKELGEEGEPQEKSDHRGEHEFVGEIKESDNEGDSRIQTGEGSIEVQNEFVGFEKRFQDFRVIWFHVQFYFLDIYCFKKICFFWGRVKIWKDCFTFYKS